MPKKGSTAEFHDDHNQFRVPFIMYADFESLLIPIDTSKYDHNQPYSQNVNEHIPSG